MYFVLLMVVILTAIGLVAIALGVARAISPRSYNPQKGEAYTSSLTFIYQLKVTFFSFIHQIQNDGFLIYLPVSPISSIFLRQGIPEIS